MSVYQQRNGKEKAKAFAKDIVRRVEILVAEHNDKVAQLNTDIQKNNRISKTLTVMSDQHFLDLFYKYA